MKNITLEWKGLGYLDKYQANIYIYDKNGFLFTTTTYNGKINICLEPEKVYQIIAISKNGQLRNRIYVDKCRNQYTFYFPWSFYARTLTFHLTDFYYKNLKIEKGEMILWPK